MSNGLDEELQAKVLEFFKKKNKILTSRDVAAGLGIENAAAKIVLITLINEGKLEFTSFGGATFIKLPDTQ